MFQRIGGDGTLPKRIKSARALLALLQQRTVPPISFFQRAPLSIESLLDCKRDCTSKQKESQKRKNNRESLTIIVVLDFFPNIYSEKLLVWIESGSWQQSYFCLNTRLVNNYCVAPFGVEEIIDKRLIWQQFFYKKERIPSPSKINITKIVVEDIASKTILMVSPLKEMTLNHLLFIMPPFGI